jgi:hypothetical protein
MEVVVMRSLVLFILLSLPIYSASAQVNSQLIDEQLSFYGEAYPEIDFVLVYKMEGFDQLTPVSSTGQRNPKSSQLVNPNIAVEISSFHNRFSFPFN